MRRSLLRSALPFGVLLVASLSLAACTGTRPPDAGPGPRTSGPPAYETFDPAGYDARPAPSRVVVEHDVPPRLMEGTVDLPEAPTTQGAPEPRTVQGFRIQVFSGEERPAAERARAEAEAWSAGTTGPGRGLRGEVAFLSPYYRVRLGEFGSRAQAEAALDAIRAVYPEAFLVPDLVTVYE